MNIKQIKELAQIVRENGLSALEFSENETKIRIECEKKIEAAAAEPVSVPDVVCIIEAMKLMNEITAEFDGKVVDVCVRNGDVVEFGQPLFKLC